jgi:hypothetical protein
MNRYTGFVSICFAVDSGSSIDVERARHRVHGLRVNAPRNDPDRVLLHAARSCEPFEVVAGSILDPRVELTMYSDFGGICLRFRLLFSGTMREWVELSDSINDNLALEGLAIECTRQICTELGDALVEPAIAKNAEDYPIYCIQVPEDQDLDTFVEANRAEIAQIVNAERFSLHHQLIRETIEGRISWYQNDSLFIDWSGAALIRHPKRMEEVVADDTIAALEFANMQLHQFDILDRRLDRAVVEAYRVPVDQGVTEADQQHLDALTIDAAELIGRVSSGLKIFSDKHQARLLRVVARRFEFQARSDEIRGKLADLRTIRQRVVDRRRHRQAHLVEVLIASLIVIEVIPLLYRGLVLLSEILFSSGASA